MTLDQLVEQLLADPGFRANVTAWRLNPAQEARYGPWPERLDPRLVEALGRRGIGRLYTHQSAAIGAALDGEDVCVVTSTASGKTLCYNLPVLDTILDEPRARALYLFPTKALAQDQHAELHGLIETTGADIKTFTYDGDTPITARRAVRLAGHIVVTNPDMLHTGVLPHHTKWLRLFENLRYVVVDELHHYRGVFGSHVANVLRRLAPHLRVLRLPPAVHLLLGHHRQPHRAGRPPHRTGLSAGGRQRRRRAAPATSSSTTRRSSTGSWASAAAPSARAPVWPACC